MTEDKRFSTYPRRDSKPVEDNGSVPVVKRRRMIPLADKRLAADSRSHWELTGGNPPDQNWHL
jgi:hypothetical protein